MFKVETIPSYDGSPYIKRWAFECRWFGVKLHRIYKPDWTRDFHDHPWSFLSVILWGGYYEKMPGDRFQICERFSVNRKKAEDFHTIASVKPNTWSLVLCGPRKRDWGFLVDGSWVQWKKYLLRHGFEV